MTTPVVRAVEAVDRPFENTSPELLIANLRSLVKTIVNGNERLKETELSEDTRKEIQDIVDSAARIATMVLKEIEERIES